MTQSWRLKFNRAQKHFEEFKAEHRRYVDSHPYEARREHKGKPKANHWRYVLRITEQPDERLALIMGDVLHNVRAGLDHLFCALVPKSRRRSIDVSFPVVDCAICQDDAGVIYLEDPKQGERFAKTVKGVDPAAIAVLCELQPGLIKTPKLHPLAVLSGLENADKHRNLVPVALGVRDVVSEVWRSGTRIGEQRRPFAEDGTEVAKFGFHPRNIPPESEVQVRVSGTPQVTVDVGVKEGDGDAFEAMRVIAEDIPPITMEALESFVRP